MADKLIDPLGVFGTSIPLSSSKHYDAGDGWDVIMTGEEIRRSKELRRISITRAEITFDSEENFKKFLEILKDSDDRLSKVPDNEVMYDWQMVRAKGLTVRFGVAWYDEDFYQEKKDAYLSDLHKNIFSRFGAKPESLRIEHIPL